MNRNSQYNPILTACIVGGLVAIGIAVGMVVAPVRAQSTFASIGYVDVQEALASHPELDNVLAQMDMFEQGKIEELAEYQDRTDLTQAEREALMQALMNAQEEIDAELDRLTTPLIDDIEAVTSEVGLEAGIEVILEAGAVMWGGLNLTPEIVRRLQNQ